MKSVFLRYKRSVQKNQQDPLADISIPGQTFDSFGPGLFGMAGLDAGGEMVSVLAAIFDLQGFTSFSGQSDPHLMVPTFVDEFISWLFGTIREYSFEERDGDTVRLFAPLPFYAKFLGDGVLFLWHIDYQGVKRFCSENSRDWRQEIQGDVGNIISVLYDTCHHYRRDFVPRLSDSFAKMPERLRCGVAQGLVCSLGDGHDYVGPCINMAARLQKLGSLGMSVLQRGVDLTLSPAERLSSILIKKKCRIAGVGEEALYVIREEFEALSAEEKAAFSDR